MKIHHFSYSEYILEILYLSALSSYLVYCQQKIGLAVKNVRAPKRESVAVTEGARSVCEGFPPVPAQSSSLEIQMIVMSKTQLNHPSLRCNLN